jgi:hypothetical protein
VVAPAELYAIVMSTLTRENIARELVRHVQPGVRRYSAHVAEATEHVGDLVPLEALEALRKQLEQPTGARARWARGAVNPALLKRLLGPVWVQLLVSFARRIPGLGGAASGGGAAAGASRGITGMIGRGVQQGAGRLVGVGRSALEGLGIDVEKKLMAAARDFSDGALSVWNQALRERLQSLEGQAIVTQIKHSVLEHVLGTRLGELDRDAVALPLAAYIDLAPAIIAHAVRVPWLRKFIDAELQAFVLLAADRPLNDFLSELGVLEETRVWLSARVDTQLLSFCQSPTFGAWIAKLADPT